VDFSESNFTKLAKIHRVFFFVDDIGKDKCKGKVHPRTDHEGPEGQYRYSFTLSLTSAIDWALPPG